MPCIALPIPALPTIPDGISFTLPKPGLPDLPKEICCKLPPLPPHKEIKPPIPGIVLNAGVMQALDNALALIEAYVDQLPLSCPRE